MDLRNHQLSSVARATENLLGYFITRRRVTLIIAHLYTQRAQQSRERGEREREREREQPPWKWRFRVIQHELRASTREGLIDWPRLALNWQQVTCLLMSPVAQMRLALYTYTSSYSPLSAATRFPRLGETVFQGRTDKGWRGEKRLNKTFVRQD